MQAFNQVILIGNLGADPEFFTKADGGRVANIRLCVNESYKDRNSGEWKQKPQWFRLFSWSPATVGYIERNLKKGRLVQIVGTLENKTYTDRDGETRYSTEIRVTQITPLDKVQRSGAQQEEHHEGETGEVPF